jgi:hypothetical protein
MRTIIATVLLLGTAVSLGACAGQQMQFDSLNKRDKLRYAACRHDVARAVCPDDPDCDIKAAELYAKEPPDSRRRWLIDYHCPPQKIDYVDQKIREDERKSIGMQ